MTFSSSNNLVKTAKKNAINDEYPYISEYYIFFKKIYLHFKYNDYIEKIKILKDLPHYLNKPNTTKANIVKNWKEDVTRKDFEELIYTMTSGYDYPSFDYLIIKHDLKLDSNNMIIFTKEFPFNNKIKKEALFIWNILYNIKVHPLLCNFLDIIIHDLQIKCESHLIKDKKKMKYDLAFPKLNIIVEIDENHRSNVFKNDVIKNVIANMNGYALFRLNFQRIYRDNKTKINYKTNNHNKGNKRNNRKFKTKCGNG